MINYTRYCIYLKCIFMKGYFNVGGNDCVAFKLPN